MFRDRGVVQVPDVDGVVTIIVRLSDGRVVRKVTLSAGASPSEIAWEVKTARRYLDVKEPPLRLVSGERKASPVE